MVVVSREIRWPGSQRQPRRQVKDSRRTDLVSRRDDFARSCAHTFVAMSTSLAPTERDERIGMLDATRGIAVLGILIMNVTGFGLPRSYDDPTNWGGADGLSLASWRIAALFFEGTMRGLFTLLFGAGALLFLQRHAGRHTGLLPADLYFRRTMWLIVFGLVNAYLLLWPGDILYYYGVVGLLLFVFRNVAPRRLVVAATVIMILQTAVTVTEWVGYQQASAAAAAAQEARSSGMVLTESQNQAIENFASTNEQFKPSRDVLEREVSRMRKSYLSALGVVAPESWHYETTFFMQHGLLECLGMMLLGMALLKHGVLTGAASRRVYATMMLVGYAIGLAVNLFETSNLTRDDFSVEALIQSYLTYDLGRIPLTLGHVGLIGLLYRLSPLSAAMRNLSAVGQMALTNYLTQSVICMFVFTGAGLALYGHLQRYELYYVVVAIWIVQLIWSPLWLRRFRFGPAEWLWRSLTYWQRQPMRQGQVTEVTRATQVT
jgi:uncharacterized protein